jgi:hypothetical protein
MATLLRTLARKSVMKFGRYPTDTVENLLKMGKHGYLRLVYFSCSNISFLDDILDELEITEALRITKPGKDPQMLGLSKLIQSGKYTKEESEIYREKVWKRRKFYGRGLIKEVNRAQKKSKLVQVHRKST